MGLRGPKPKGKVNIKWSADFAYAIGLLVSDGCLSSDGRHIDLTSNDREQLENFCRALNIEVDIKKKDKSKEKSLRIQFGDVLFYNFLISIGVTPKKSKTIREIKIPKEFFFDFLRGSFDGDGSFYSYWDKRWKSSHMFYVSFYSASRKHIKWIQNEIKIQSDIEGHISKSQSEGSVYGLRYAKKESLVIIKKMYYNHNVVCLKRKKDKIRKAIKIEEKQQLKYI